MNRQFAPVEADRLWVMDVTEHPTGTGKVYLAVVLDAWSRRVVGWSIADHIRSELVVDARQMAVWRTDNYRGHRGALRSRLPIHVMGVRQTATSRRPARLHGQRRRRL